MTHQPAPNQPHAFSLKGITLSRFIEAFGDASNSMMNDHQWSLKTAPFAGDLFVLIHGPVNRPVVWIFDSNDRNDGVSCSVIEDESCIIDIIDHVRHRVIKGSKTRRKHQNLKGMPNSDEMSDADTDTDIDNA